MLLQKSLSLAPRLSSHGILGKTTRMVNSSRSVIPQLSADSNLSSAISLGFIITVFFSIFIQHFNSGAMQ